MCTTPEVHLADARVAVIQPGQPGAVNLGRHHVSLEFRSEVTCEDSGRTYAMYQVLEPHHELLEQDWALMEASPTGFGFQQITDGGDPYSALLVGEIAEKFLMGVQLPSYAPEFSGRRTGRGTLP